jgi:hypothetical protein
MPPQSHDWGGSLFAPDKGEAHGAEQHSTNNRLQTPTLRLVSHQIQDVAAGRRGPRYVQRHGLGTASREMESVEVMTDNPQTEPVYSTLLCSAAYHITQLKGKGSAIAFTLYDTHCRLGYKTHKSFLNLKTVVAPYLHCHRTELGAATALLEDAGWLIAESRKPGSPTCYRPIEHDAWAATHVGCCVQTYAPDYWDQDPLGKAFFGITGGIKVGGPNVLAGWRKLFPQDELIISHAEKYVALAPIPGHTHEYTTWLKGFGEYLREQSC